MSGPLELYRTTVNLRGLGSGTDIEIDPSDPGWAGDIRSRRIVPANRATSETYLTDDDEPCFDGVHFGDLPTDDAVGRSLREGPAPHEWVEDWDSGAIVAVEPWTGQYTTGSGEGRDVREGGILG
jgi:hypothetical protein